MPLRFLTEPGGTDADVIFIHGLRLFGEKGKTDWTADPRDAGQFWPKWLQDDVPGVRVGILSYDASASKWVGHAMHLEDRARNLAETLRLSDIGSRKVIFVAHSLGGLVVKEMIRQSLVEAATSSPDASHAGLAHATVGVVFLATPHSGSILANIATALRPARPSAAIETLLSNNSHLANLAIEYRNWAANHASSVQHLVLREGRPLRNGVFVVPAGSADPGIAGAGPVTMDADHLTIMRPATRDDPIYQSVRRFASELLRQQTPTGVLPARSRDIRAANAETLARLRRAFTTRPFDVRLRAIPAILAQAEYDWRADLAEQISVLRSAGVPARVLPDIHDSEGSLEGCVEQLRALDMGAIAKAAQARRSDDALIAIDWLRRAIIETPAFRSAIPVAGSWGAGKSHLIVNVCDELRRKGFIIVSPRRTDGGRLEDRIIRAFNGATGAEAHDLKQAEAWLRRTGDRALFVMDDAHLEPDAHRIIDLIADTQSSGRSTWLVTADADRMDALMGDARSRAWRHHGLPADLSQSGWLELDGVNAAERIGMRIVSRATGGSRSTDLADLERDPDLIPGTLLWEPWAAWLKAESSRGEMNVWEPDAAFAESLWNEYRGRLQQLGAATSVTEHCRSTLIRKFGRRHASDIAFGDVLPPNDDGAWTKDQLRQALWAFLDAGMLERRALDEAVSEDIDDVVLAAEPAALWSRWLFEEAARGEDASEGVLAPWRQAADDHNWTSHLVVTHWLSSVTLPRVGAGDRAARALMRSWIQTPSPASSAMWIALRTAPQPQRKLAAGWIFEARPRPVNPRECLLFMRMLQSYRNSEWARRERLVLLSDRFALIGRWDLGAVALDVVGSVLDYRTVETLPATLDVLKDFDKTGYGVELAAMLISGYRRQHPWASIFAQLIHYLRTLSPVVGSRRGVELQHMKERLRGDTEEVGWWRAIVKQAIRDFVWDEGTDAYERLRKWGWFEPGCVDTVRLAMLKAAHTELGAVYRRRGRTGRVAFLHFMEKLVSADSRARESAVYVITHTEITHGSRSVRVDDVFFPLLRILSQDPQLIRSVPALPRLLEANGIQVRTGPGRASERQGASQKLSHRRGGRNRR